MIYKQDGIPALATRGDAWVCPRGTFKRVLSRGGAWENVNLGSKHPDEVDHDNQEQRAKAQQQDDRTQVSERPDQTAQGPGDNGQGSGFVPGAGETSRPLSPNDPDFARQRQNQAGGVSVDGEPLTSTGSIEDPVDGTPAPGGTLGQGDQPPADENAEGDENPPSGQGIDKDRPPVV